MSQALGHWETTWSHSGVVRPARQSATPTKSAHAVGLANRFLSLKGNNWPVFFFPDKEGVVMSAPLLPRHASC